MPPSIPITTPTTIPISPIQVPTTGPQPTKDPSFFQLEGPSNNKGIENTIAMPEGEDKKVDNNNDGMASTPAESLMKKHSQSTRPKDEKITESCEKMMHAATLEQLNDPRSKSIANSNTREQLSSRHISLQSMVDSIAAEEGLYGRYGFKTSIPAINTINWQRRSNMTILRSLLGSTRTLVGDYSSEERARIPVDPKSAEPPIEGSKLIQMSATREALFVGVCAVSHLMTQAALGQALVPIDMIARDFGQVSPGEQSWFIAAYSLTVGTFIMISGQLGDIFGHKRVFAFGYAWLGAWSGFAGFAAYTHSQIFFDLCRALQGIGPALLMPNALALFGRAYAPGSLRKNIVFSVFGALAPAGFVIGGFFSSLFAQLVWWPWGFWSYGIAAFFLAAIALLVIPKPLSERPSVKPEFDWSGCVTVVAGLVLINVAFNNGPIYGWHQPFVYFVLIIGLLCMGGFVWVEFHAVNPLLPIRALDSTVGYVLALVGLGWGAFGVWVYYTARFLHLVRGESALMVSAQFTPAIIAGLLAAGLTGFLLTHTPVSFVMMLSMLAFIAGIAISTFQPEHQTYWAQTFVAIVVMPFGMDMSFPAATVILSNHMPPEHQGLAASLVNTVVNYSISIALGVAATVEVSAPGHHVIMTANRNAHYTALGLAALGVIFGALFFARSLMKEGWKVMGH